MVNSTSYQYGLFLIFDNFKLLLSRIASFEETNRSQSLSLEDVDQAIFQLTAAAATIQLLVSGIENDNDFTYASWFP